MARRSSWPKTASPPGTGTSSGSPAVPGSGRIGGDSAPDSETDRAGIPSRWPGSVWLSQAIQRVPSGVNASPEG